MYSGISFEVFILYKIYFIIIAWWRCDVGFRSQMSLSAILFFLFYSLLEDQILIRFFARGSDQINPDNVSNVYSS